MVKDERLGRRHGVLLSARLDIGGALLDCLVLDASSRGVRLQFGAPVVVPEHVRLILRDGSVQAARRRWSRGTQVGLEFVGATSARFGTLDGYQVQAMLERVQASDPARWLPALRAESYYGNPEIREAAEAAEAAHLRLVAALRRHAGERP